MKKREFEYKIEYEIDKKAKRVTAVIPELNHVSSFGDSFAEAEATSKKPLLRLYGNRHERKGGNAKPSFNSKELT